VSSKKKALPSKTPVFIVPWSQILGLFNDCVSTTKVIKHKMSQMIESVKQIIIWKEAVIGHLAVLSQYSPAETEVRQSISPNSQ
jgi:hypothetical protein